MAAAMLPHQKLPQTMTEWSLRAYLRKILLMIRKEKTGAILPV